MTHPTGDGDASHPGSGTPSEGELLRRLRDAEEFAFAELIDAYHAPLCRFLRSYVPSHDLAEDVAQETWIAVLQGLDRFEGRSSLKTWIFRIGAFRAQSRMRKERRSISFSALKAMFSRGEEDDGGVEEILPAGFSSETGMWTSPPDRWEDHPETKLLSDETLAFVRETIHQLSPMQASVITLRDIENWTAPEVCDALDISEANQRVILHRARLKVRKALESRLDGGTT